MKQILFSLAALAFASSGARASDHLVDASGIQSPLLNLTQAMAVAVPGDRIFVLPGTYPAFHFSRGVEVIGLGASPADVTIARVDFHPNAPVNHFDAALSNVTVCSSDSADSTSISGNELAEGTLVLDGVVTCGGVYLRGAGSFYLLVVNTRVDAGPGDGFLGAAFDFGGGIADFVGARIVGGDASVAEGSLAGVGLRIGGGATVRLSGSEVQGGDGVSAALPAFGQGADAIEKGFGAGATRLRLSGFSWVQGGSGWSAAGGAGVDLSGEILLGQATVQGGAGTPAGLAYAVSPPLALAHDPLLSMTPDRSFALGDTFLRPPSQAVVQPGALLPQFEMGYAFQIDRPTTAVLSPLPANRLQWVPGSQLVLTANGAALQTSLSVHGFPRRRIYVQGFFRDFEGGPLQSTNPVAITIAVQ